MNPNTDEVLSQAGETGLDVDDMVPMPVGGGRLGTGNFVDDFCGTRLVDIEALEEGRVMMDRDGERELRNEQKRRGAGSGKTQIQVPSHETSL